MLHRPGTNLTLSAPKPVSVAALIGGDRRILAARDRAVEAGWPGWKRTSCRRGSRIRTPAARSVPVGKGRWPRRAPELKLGKERFASAKNARQGRPKTTSRSMVDREGSLPRTSHTQYFVPQRKLPSCLIDEITMPKFALKSYRQAANSTSKSSVTGTNLSSAIAHAAWPPNIAET